MQVGPLVGKARHVRLDGSAISHLEVLRSSSGTTEGSLLGVLDTCSTNGGRRLLRGWLCQPLFDVQPIRRRQQAVQAILAHCELMDTVHVGCCSLPDMDRCVPLLSCVLGRGLPAVHSWASVPRAAIGLCRAILLRCTA